MNRLVALTASLTAACVNATVVLDESVVRSDTQGKQQGSDFSGAHQGGKINSQTVIIISPQAPENNVIEIKKATNPEDSRLRSIQNSKRQSIRYSEKD
ncbi:MAG TPA: hypothetical protein PK347_09925 [Burkholderiaceae bacterium]|nr:hypothetical protein [Burkholderiaceae bacterium]